MLAAIINPALLSYSTLNVPITRGIATSTLPNFPISSALGNTAEIRITCVLLDSFCFKEESNNSYFTPLEKSLKRCKIS